MLARVRKIFGCDTATLLLSSADRQRLHVRACDGLERAAWDRLEVPCGVGVVGRIATSGEPAIVDDLASADVVTTVLQERLRSLAGVPLVLKGTVMGVLHIGCAQPRKFAREDIDLLEMVAARVALGLDRAATYTELQQTLRHNEIFTGVLAHDLRNPLGAIRTAAELLLLRQKDERKEITRPLHRIISSSQRITGLIDCVLDFTRTRVDGRVMLHAREADIGELCRQVVAELALAKPDWRVEVASRGDLHGTWDPDRLPQVLSNVIANAGRQGSAGSKILVDLDGADPRGVTLRVHDDGRIPEALLPNLFSPFRGVEERRGGLGLGLFIARAVVVSHGGTIDVTSSSAAGTTFTITLPRHVCLGDPA
jgi:signal transduction histidine kinase